MSKKDRSTAPALKVAEQAFVVAFFEQNMNATLGYRSLHPNAGYNTARVEASKLLARPAIQQEIRRILGERLMSAEEALYRLSAIARASVYPFLRIDSDGFAYFNFADPEAKGYLFLIKKIKSKRERRIDGRGDDAQEWEGEWVEVELHDAQTALTTILKVHGRLVEKLDVTTTLPADAERRLAEIYAILKQRAQRSNRT